MFDLNKLCARIEDLLRRQGSALCAECLTDLAAGEHGADDVDMRVAVVHLSLSLGFTSSGTCGKCGLPDQFRNPVLQATSEAVTSTLL
jgi:hypothetical protein